MSIFFRIKFPREQVAEEVAPASCPLGFCDGSGLVEREGVWRGVLRYVRCECRK